MGGAMLRRVFTSVLSRALLSSTVVLVAACGEDLALQEVPTAEHVARGDLPGAQPVEPIVLEAEVAMAAEEPALGPPYPIVLVHGFSGFRDLGPLDYFFRVVDDLTSQGHEVYAPALPPYNGSAHRARVLARFVDDVLAQSGRAKVHLIAHSQGGIDSRRLISVLGYADKVASLTTIATPHRGTPLADIAKTAPEGVLNPAGKLLAWLIGFLDAPPRDDDWRDDRGDPWIPEMADALEQLSTDGMQAFNGSHPDPEGVPLFSVAAYSNLQSAPRLCDDGSRWRRSRRTDPIDPLLVTSGLVLSGANPLRPRANDGIVPSDSQVWGTFLGCVPADHFDEVGQIADVVPHVLSGFDHLALFRALVDNARRVEPLLDDE